MTKPTLIAVHDQPPELEIIQRELRSRYGADTPPTTRSCAKHRRRRLWAVLRERGAQVVALSAATDMTAMSGIEYLQRAHELHPRAQRVLLIPGVTARRPGRSSRPSPWAGSTAMPSSPVVP